MNPLTTKGIVLSRTDFGEADRIVTILTPEQGKLRLMARGVRKIKSKLAGGIELFSISDITYITGKGEIGTLISSRLDEHYGNIVKDIDRVQLGYELIKLLNKLTEDQPEAEYFNLLADCYSALDDSQIDLDLVRLWFQAQLLKLSGYTPNFKTDTSDKPLTADQTYSFDLEAMTLSPNTTGKLGTNHIKLLRLLFSGHTPRDISRVKDITSLIRGVSEVIEAASRTYLPLANALR